MKSKNLIDQNQAYAFLAVVGTLVATALISAQFVQAQLVNSVSTPDVDVLTSVWTPKNAESNKTMQVTMNVMNRGTLSSGPVMASLRIPQGMSYAEPVPSGCKLASTSTLNCSVAAMGRNQSNRVTANVRTTSSFGCNKTGVVSATARTAEGVPDGDPKNNIANAFITVTCPGTTTGGGDGEGRSSSSSVGISDISISRYERQADMQAERPGLVVAKITNLGPSDANGVNVMFAHDRWMQWNPTALGVATCTNTNDTQVSCSTRRLVANETLLVPLSFTPRRELGLNTPGKFGIAIQHLNPSVTGGRNSQPLTNGRIVVDKNHGNDFLSLELRVTRNFGQQ